MKFGLHLTLCSEGFVNLLGYVRDICKKWTQGRSRRLLPHTFADLSDH
jgi:hypothetical protein